MKLVIDSDLFEELMSYVRAYHIIVLNHSIGFYEIGEKVTADQFALQAEKLEKLINAVKTELTPVKQELNKETINELS